MNEHHRRSIRLKDYDYTQNGAYVVTICTHGRESLFGDIVDGEMRLNDFGRIVEEEWWRTETIRPEIELDAFVVMPNHIHGIIVIIDGGDVGAHGRAPLQKPGVAYRPPRSLGSFVAGFKSAVTKRINAQRDTPNAPVWQRNFYEQVIRNEFTLNEFRGYIVTNPGRWADDRENLAKGSRN